MKLFTYSGRAIDPANVRAGDIAIEDVAIGLDAARRWAGHTALPFSVLDHTLFAFRLYAFSLPENEEPGLPGLAILLHDAHEAYLGDIPTPFRVPAVAEVKRALDLAIMGAFFPGGYDTYRDYLNDVKVWDSRAARAEAAAILAPGWEHGIPEDVLDNPENAGGIDQLREARHRLAVEACGDRPEDVDDLTLFKLLDLGVLGPRGHGPGQREAFTRLVAAVRNGTYHALVSGATKEALQRERPSVLVPNGAQLPA